MKTVTIHSDNANDLFEVWQVWGNVVRWVKGKRCGEWVVPNEKLKLKLSNNVKLQNDETRKAVH